MRPALGPHGIDAIFLVILIIGLGLMGLPVALVVFLGGMMGFALWLETFPPETQIVIFLAIGITLLAGMGAVTMFIMHLIQQRHLQRVRAEQERIRQERELAEQRERERLAHEAAWRAAMDEWLTGGGNRAFYTAKDLDWKGLEQFAAQVYRYMGYQVEHTGRTGDHGRDVHMINPQGQVEIVSCKQWDDSVGEPPLRDLAGTMTIEGAVRGYIWAPKGNFSRAAIKWHERWSAKESNPPIHLMTDEEISRLVWTVYGGQLPPMLPESKP